MDTHDKEGQRERYFADDDRYDLKEMVRREKMRTAEDHNAMMARLSSKVSKLTLTVTMRYSRNSPCDNSRKGPALVTITFVEPCLNCGLNFVMKSYRKRQRTLLGLPIWTSPLFLSSRKRSASIVLLGLNAVSDQLSSYRRPLSVVIANESFDCIWMSLCYIHTLFTVPDPDFEMKFFRPFGPQFGQRIRGGPGPPGPSPGSATGLVRVAITTSEGGS